LGLVESRALRETRSAGQTLELVSPDQRKGTALTEPCQLRIIDKVIFFSRISSFFCFLFLFCTSPVNYPSPLHVFFVLHSLHEYLFSSPCFSIFLHKVLVFSWSTQTLDVLGAFCQAHGWPYTRLDGSTPTKSRQQLVDTFNASASSFVFLCSTKAGGVGINLQSASKVIIFDVNWNPSFDQQAQDRAYRIGQTKDVSVFRLVCQVGACARLFRSKRRRGESIVDGMRLNSYDAPCNSSTH